MTRRTVHKLLGLVGLMAVPLLAGGSATAGPGDAQWRQWVVQMKQERLGPFESVRWFCADGSVLPPKPYACRPHGGGRQHGLRGARAATMRAAGIPLANVLAEITPEEALAQQAFRLKAVLVEQHLAALDDGWIFRQARYARGVFQIEAETAAAERILRSMAANSNYAGDDMLLLREALRRLPGSGPGELLDTVRTQASVLADRDPGFARLRNKIHSRLEPTDATAVREYAAAAPARLDRAPYLSLADNIDSVFRPPPLAGSFERASQAVRDPALRDFAARWRAAQSASARLETAASAMSLLRIRLAGYPAAQRLAALRLSLNAEEAVFVAGRELSAELPSLSASERLARLGALLRALHGTGLLTGRELAQAQEVLRGLSHPQDITLGDYRAALDALSRPPVWAANRLHFHLGETLRAFGRVEPKVELLIPDRLRAGPALAYGEILESLAAEADRLAGIRHELFGQPARSGLRALNPGLGRGPFHALETLGAGTGTPAVVLAPESAADLPAVAGILTAAEGNALSHVQLLARNLGVPNVVVGAEWLPRAREFLGRDVVLAASPAGVVRLALDGPQWQAVFPSQAERPTSIEVNLQRLDLSARLPRPMAGLRAEDSGRTVGPKAAKLGELAARYPEQVSPGVAVPFGAFGEVLAAPHPSGGTVKDWLRRQYRTLAALPAGEARETATAILLAEVRERIENHRYSPAFRDALRAQLAAAFGPDGSYGVFVRSDTNVEDLPGFTGAGLNLTVPHVVGLENILTAIRQVWASPFTQRAYGWRQSLMDQPEELYVAVLLHRTVPADKSGVMITSDLASNDPGWVTVATNEGVGGGVEGQAAESLKLALDGSRVELLASATEPRQRVVLAEGGTALLPAKAPETLLSPAEIEALLRVARSLPDKYPRMLDAGGKPAPADVEFAFADGVLYLNQIRPFLQSQRARRNAYLLSLDAELAERAGRRVDLETLR